MDSIEQLLAELEPEQRKALLDRLEAGEPEVVARRDPDTPLSSGQQRLWFLHQLEPDNPTYNICQRFGWPGTLDPVTLTAALGDVVARHESLRTRILSGRDEPYQVVDPPGPVAVRWVDLSADDELERTLGEEADAPFDLERGPLLRVTVIQSPASPPTVMLTQHHIISDAWSVSLVLDDLDHAYQERAAGRAPVFAELPWQYRDFAHWQRDRLTSGAVDGQLAYWRESLADGVATLELPSDQPRANGRGRGAVFRTSLPQPLVSALQTLGREQSTTTFMTALAGFQAVLHRWTGSAKVPIGAPISNRTRPELESVAGFFLNTLLLQADFAGDPTFADLLAQVRGTVLGAFDNQEAPFERIVEDLAPGRSGVRNPLTPILFSFSAQPSTVDQPLPVTEVHTSGARAELCVILESGPSGESIQIHYEYDRDLFDASTVERLHGHYCRLMAAAAADPSLRVSRLPLLTEAEEVQIAQWNATDVDHPLHLTIAELVGLQAAATPDTVALVDTVSTIDYRELDLRANRLAHRLISLGVQPGDYVGVLLDRSCELVVSLLAILRAGGVYVPLDPSYPADRLGYILSDAQAPVLVGSQELYDRLAVDDRRPVLVSPVDSAAFPSTVPDVPHGPDDIAYVIYTSGSTGRPKGVMITHAGLVNHTLWMRDTFAIGAGDRVLQKTPMGFDVSMWELTVPLVGGATLVMAKPDGHKDPAYLARVIQDQAITVVHFVPSMLQVFLETADVSGCQSLRQVFCSGETLPGETLKRFLSSGLTAELGNLYGPTETVIHCTGWPCGPQDTANVPIGHAIDNTQMHILDEYGSPVAVGRAGELYVGGVQISAGYHGRPNLTDAVFVPDPFSTNARMYRTGDLVRRRSDGALEFLGRLDHQVKLRGFRVELGEIESVLADHPTVSEAVVLLREDIPGDPRLIGHYVPADPSVTEEELRAHLDRVLPAYMVPALLLPLAAMPLTANGKTDRKALATTVLPTSETAEYVAPRDEVEETLAGLFEELLNLDRVSVQDSFFDLGGHSLLATRLAARIRRDFGVDLPLRDLFDAPTVEDLASWIVETLMSRLAPEEIDAVLQAES